MKCFEHEEQDAVGVCRVCHKAVCHDCYIIAKGNLACSDECKLIMEDDLEIHEILMDGHRKSKEMYLRKPDYILYLVRAATASLFCWGFIFILSSLYVVKAWPEVELLSPGFLAYIFSLCLVITNYLKYRDLNKARKTIIADRHAG